jgi:hypothetical protein
MSSKKATRQLTNETEYDYGTEGPLDTHRDRRRGCRAQKVVA